MKRWLPLLPIAGILVWHSLYFNFVSDDAYISFVYSRNFAEHGQLVFNLGDRVEGYTNFLWTVILGILMKLGIQPENSSRVLGTMCGIATLAISMKISERVRGKASYWDYLPPLLLACSSGFACWCSGGLETQLFTMLVAAGLWRLLEDRPIEAGVLLALASMARPEGLLVMAIAGAHQLAWCLVEQRWPRREELLGVAAFLGIFAPYFLWRWHYYGWLFPNTFYVKATGKMPASYTKEMLHHGLYYVWQWARSSKAIYGAPFALWAIWRRPRFGSLAAALTVAYLVYTIKVGGDFMGLHRFVMPIFVTTALLVSIGFADLIELISPAPEVALAGLAPVIPFAISQIWLDRQMKIPKADFGIDRPGYLKVYSDDRGLLGKALAPSVTPDDFAFVGGVGVEPYYARMRAMDCFGLVSTEVAHTVPPSNPRPGHQKWSPASLVLKYAPTFIMHCYDLHRDPSRYGLCGEAGEFERAGYRPATMYVPGLKERGEYYTFLVRCDRACPIGAECEPCTGHAYLAAHAFIEGAIQ
jgi:hypothetical protein